LNFIETLAAINAEYMNNITKLEVDETIPDYVQNTTVIIINLYKCRKKPRG